MRGISLLAVFLSCLTLSVRETYAAHSASPDDPEPAPVGEGPEPAPAGDGPEPAPAGDGLEPAPAGDGPEPAPSGFAANGAPLTPTLQQSSLEGKVLTQGNRDPLQDVQVQLLRPTSRQMEPIQQTTTDASGRFLFLAVPAGDYRVALRGPPIEPTEVRERIRVPLRKGLVLYAPLRKVPFGAVVRAAQQARSAAEHVLDASELTRIPGNQNDPIKAIQNLPGVARVPVTSGQLIIWGSAPRDTAVYAEGVEIPSAFHAAGLRSVIPGDFVSEVSFKPGAYGADFGRRLGGLVDIKLRAPSSDKLHGSVSLDLIDGAVTLEGAITKNLHFFAGARVSWISAFLPLFKVSDYQLSPSYWDYQLALRYRPSIRNELDVFILGATDRISIRNDAPDPAVQLALDTHSYFSRVILRWIHRISPQSVLTVQPYFGGTVQRATTGELGLGGIPLSTDSTSVDYGLRAELQQRLPPFVRLTTGIELAGYRTQYDVTTTQGLAGTLGDGSSDRGSSDSPSPLQQSIAEQTVLHSVSVAPYLISHFEFWNGRLIVSPQLRLSMMFQQAYEGTLSNNFVTPEPRLFLSVQIIPRWLRWKFGIGSFHQVPAVREASLSYGNPQLDQQQSTTYVTGFESDLSPTLSAQGQFFYREFRSLIVTDPYTRYSNFGIGRTVGGDFLLRQRLWKGLFGWLSYTVSRSERKDSPDEPWRLFSYDQTHIFTLIASYRLPFPRLGLEVGLRFRYISGNPTTPVLGGIRDTGSQTWTPIVGTFNSDRLPDFHQLDLRIDRTWVFNRWKFALYLDLQNLYANKNTEQLAYGGRQLSQSAPVTGLPFFPNLGLRADF